MQKYTYKTDDGTVYEFIYSDGTPSSLTIGEDGIVVYSRGNRKTKFTLAECKNYNETDVLGNAIVFTENDADMVMLAIMVGEQRLMRNNDHAETGNHEEYNENIADPENIEDMFLRKQDSETLLQAVSKMKPAEQYIIHLLYLDDVTVSQAELAKELKIKESAMWKRTERIKGKLKKVLIK